MATAVDGRTVRVRAPATDERVAFLAEIEKSTSSTPARGARSILNARTGSIVMNQAVTLDACAVAHGNLSVTVEQRRR